MLTRFPYVFLTFMLALCVPLRLQGQPEQVKFEHLSVAQGLSNRNVTAVLQDRKGFLWIGTQDGLNKYDGYHFQAYKHDPDDLTSLSHNNVWAIYEDPEGMLWIGTYGGGLNRFDPSTETFTRYRHDPNDPGSLGSDRVHTIYGDRSGTLWLGTLGGGLNRFNPETGTFTRYRHDPNDPGSLSDDWVRSICEDRGGMLWVGTMNGGLNRLDPATGTFTWFQHDPGDPASLSPGWVNTIREDRSGTLWIGTREGGINRFNPATQSFTRYLADPEHPTGLSNRDINPIYEDRSGTLWVGTWGGGLNRFDPETGTFTRYRHDPEDPSSLAEDRIRTIHEDRTGVLWIGTAGGGLSRFDRAAGNFTHYRHHPANPHSLSEDWVEALYEDRSGTLWVGSVGLNRFDPETHSFTRYLHDPKDPNSLSENFVQAIEEDPAGILWIGTHNSGLNRFDRKAGRFTHYRHDPSDPRSLSHDNILVIRADRREGVLWIGTAGGGLNRFDPSTETFTRYRHDPNDPGSLLSDHVQAIHESRSGVLWIGTWSGLSRFDRQTGRFTHYTHAPNDRHSLSSAEVTTIHEDASGILWVGTDGGGFNRFDPAAGRFTRFTEQNSDLPSNRILGILEDDAGNLWMSTFSGLTRFDPRRKAFKNYDVDRGLQSREFNPGAYCKSRSGALLFGGTEGFNLFFPEAIQDNPHPPQVVLTDFKLFNESVRPGKGGLLPRPIHEIEQITLDDDKNDLSFEFVALHYSNPAKNRYAYMLEHYDATWRDAGTQRTATYTNLDPGEYVFRVKAASRDGVWNEEGASIRILIRPPWWQRWWAYVLYALLLAGSLAVVDGVWRKQALRKEREQAQIREQELRTQAAEAWASYLQAENERQTQELEQARQLQLSMLPENVPEHPVVELAAFMQTATEVGGDYYDFHVAEDGTLTLAIGDATGHGAQAGTMVTAAKSLFTNYTHEPDIVDVLRRATRALKQMNLPRLYMALALAKLQGRTLEIVGAGMPPALVYRAATGTVEEVPLKGMPLGSFVDFPYHKTTVELQPGDTVLLMSDGFPELFNPDGHMLGYEEAIMVFEEVASGSPEEIIRHFTLAAQTWAGTRPQNDDVTFIVMKVKAEVGSTPNGRAVDPSPEHASLIAAN